MGPCPVLSPKATRLGESLVEGPAGSWEPPSFEGRNTCQWDDRTPRPTYPTPVVAAVNPSQMREGVENLNRFLSGEKPYGTQAAPE